MVNTPRPALILCLVGMAVHPAAAQMCTPGWSDRFTTAVLTPLPGAGIPWVTAQAVYDDGSGPALIIGGGFATAGGVVANSIARWDGTAFRALGTGLSGNSYGAHVSALAVFDPDGPGPSPPLLIAGGYFIGAGGVPVRGIAAWNGSNWSAIQGAPALDEVSDLNVVDPGSAGPGAPLLYVTAGSAIWTWDSAVWAQLPVVGGYPWETRSTRYFAPDRPGADPPAVYSCQSFSFSATGCYIIHGAMLGRLAGLTWQGIFESSCSAPCSTGCPDGFPGRLELFDPDGPGPSPPLLILAGSLDELSGAPAHHLAAYDGVAWSPFAGDADQEVGVFPLTDPNTQLPSLYASGHNFTVGGVTALSLARFDAAGWTAIPYALGGEVSSMVPFAVPGQLPAIYVGGPTFAGAPAPGWGRLTAVGWSPIGQCLNNEVHALSVYTPPGGSPVLYAGGAFTAAAGQLAVSFARWDGARWSPAANLNNHVDCMVPFGSYLAIGGKFTLGGLTTGGVGLFDGQTVLQLGSGMNTPVHALGVLNSQLYAGGEFTTAGGIPAIGIARWNGSAWTAVGSGANNHVDAIATFDDGTGPALYVGGKFTAAGGLAAAHIARWNGSAWLAIPGDGTDGDVEALTVLNDGSGPALYVGGAFTHAGGVPANHIARFRGGAWTALGSGTDGTVRALSALDPDGPGFAQPVLVAGGDFLAAGGLPAPYSAIWNGSAWEQMGTALDNHVLALAPFDPSGTGAPSIYVGGAFYNSGGIPSPFIAQWTRCAPCYANCDNSTTSPVLNVNDFMCFLNRFAAGDSYANCDGSTTPPVLNVNDFTCFLDRAAAGCP